MITDDSLKQIMPNLASAKRAAFLPPLQSALAEFQVNTPRREAAFLAQIAHESGEFRWMEEIWGPTEQQLKYEPPNRMATALGNTQPGDGQKYKGRGLFQITGKDRYQKFSEISGYDLVANPELASTFEVATLTACIFWQRNGLNELADKGEFSAITQRISGGYNGLEDRLQYYNRALEVLKVK